MELYLDSAATTSIDPEALAQYIDLLQNHYGSTGSLHSYGEYAHNLENQAKAKIASLLKVKENEIFFNSGATEGNNYAIKGVAFNYKNRGNTIITTKVEHPSVLECVRQLEKDYHFNCIYLDVNEDGVVDVEELKKHLSNDVILVSIMYVNHEVGSIMPIKKIKEAISKYPKIIFHSDITQAIGKTNVDLSLVDIATMSAHKIHGIKGSGFLYKKEKITLYPLFSGHPAYNALRAGTAAWQSNVAMATALNNTLKHMKENEVILKECQKKLISELNEIDEIVVHTNPNCSISGIVNFSPLHYNPEVLIRALSTKGIYVSTRSVCSVVNSADLVSATLQAMNKSTEECISSIRLSFDRPLSDDEIDYFITSLKECLQTVKRMN